MSKLVLGIELGSTRIKSVLIDETSRIIAQGEHEWENSLKDGFWTYSLEEVEQGLQHSYADLKAHYRTAMGSTLTTVDAIGISAMMHGYLAFDEQDTLLVPFRTWRNTNTEQAANELSHLFSFNIPQRWSVSHFYQAVLNGEPHVGRVSFLTTLAGYIHYRLTGEKVLGVGDASGMFPIENKCYTPAMLKKLDGKLRTFGITRHFEELLPRILTAGQPAGSLTSAGALFLDPDGDLHPGCLLCPPEGDAGTGMTATNSIAPHTANISAGTSGFLMAVLEKNLNQYYPEIDMVTTPTGDPVAMVHVNNFTCDINAWASLFGEVIALAGGSLSKGDLFSRLFRKALDSDESAGNMVAYNFLSGEPIAGIENGRPLMLRQPDGVLSLANFMQTLLYAPLGALAMGMEILKNENVILRSVCGHGGFFKTEFVGQNAVSAALGAPVTVLENAGEGGAWGVALLALFSTQDTLSLADFLNRLFADSKQSTVMADEAEQQKFARFMERYKSGLNTEKAAEEVPTCWRN